MFTVITRSELLSTLQEIAGFKAGLALSKEEIKDLLMSSQAVAADADYERMLADDEQRIIIRGEEYEELALALLHKIGNIPVPIPSRWNGYPRQVPRSGGATQYVRRADRKLCSPV